MILLMIRRPPRSTLVPDTTLFRSDAKWVDNGPGWVGVLLEDARAVLALRPDLGAMGDLDIGVAGLWRDGGSDADLEIGRSTRLNSSHANISYAVFCLKKTISHSYS